MLYAKNGGFPISDLDDLGDPEKKSGKHMETPVICFRSFQGLIHPMEYHEIMRTSQFMFIICYNLG